MLLAIGEKHSIANCEGAVWSDNLIAIIFSRLWIVKAMSVRVPTGGHLLPKIGAMASLLVVDQGPEVAHFMNECFVANPIRGHRP